VRRAHGRVLTLVLDEEALARSAHGEFTAEASVSLAVPDCSTVLTPAPAAPRGS
jgi:hypothetical protein